MPFAIDEDKMKSGVDQILSLDPAKPPVKPIPHMEYPRAVYKHPLEPFITIEHRNNLHELVEEEVVATEHISMTVANKEELEKARKDGWVLEPYIPETPPDKKATLYGKSKPKSA